MTKVGLIQFLILLFVVSAAHSQKIKYKDVFGLLSTKQYEQAEPFLKKYLEANDDNPNAFLFMGIIYHEKSLKNDILKQTEIAIKNMDSAYYFFDKANKTIDEREIKKNKEYYQAYNRRDLRTGEFGVKLSDIQFDTNKKMEGLKERIDKVKMVKHYFTMADTLYSRSQVLFLSLQNAYPGEKEFYLRADDKMVNTLQALATRYDSAMKFLDHYRSSLNNLGNTGYSQQVQRVDIADFKQDGRSKADFYASDIKLWDYKKFATQAVDVIEKDIKPMREHLVSYDVELNKLREKLTEDSISVRSDLTKLIDKMLFDNLKKFDDNPLPINVFAMKTADLEYKSSLIEHKKLRDSADVQLQVKLIEEEMKYLDKLDSAAGKLNESNIEEEIKDYEHFIAQTYSNSVILKSYVKALKEFAERERRDRQEILNEKREALNWLIVEDKKVPLIDSVESVFKPVLVTDDEYTVGFLVEDSVHVSGYFYTITPSRVPDITITFPLDKAAFKESVLPDAKALTTTSGDQIYFVVLYSEQEQKYPASIAKIYRSDGLAWCVNQALKIQPASVSYKADSGELVLLDTNQQVVLTLDKNGKAK